MINASATHSRPITLSARQRGVLQHLSEGDTNRTIAQKLGVSESTVNSHIRDLMKKFGVHNRTQVVIFAQPFLTDETLEIL